MLNHVFLQGRLVRDVELRSTQSGTSVATLTVAVDRDYARDGASDKTDFVNVVCWKQTAEFISKHFGKGRMIAVTGRLQSRTYDDKNGSKHYVTEVIVEQASFTGEPKQTEQEEEIPY